MVDKITYFFCLIHLQVAPYPLKTFALYLLPSMDTHIDTYKIFTPKDSFLPHCDVST